VFPKVIRDSSQIIRATLYLVPAVPARGTPADSFVVEARNVLADFGAKVPDRPAARRLGDDPPGATDTVKIEVTNLLQQWAADSTRPTVSCCGLKRKAQSSARSVLSVRRTAFRPTLQITFVRRFPFGAP